VAFTVEEPAELADHLRAQAHRMVRAAPPPTQQRM
jgi:hypothetical protein